MKTYNTAPYYDDFDQAKNFYQVLFNPGYAVQARELTQLQTILRDQIEKFGNHVFKHGSVVIPGNSFADLAVPYVTVQTTHLGSSVPSTTLLALEGRVIAGPETTVTNGIAWSSGASVTAQTFIINGTNRYLATNSGTLGVSAPTHTSGTVVNGTVSLTYDGTTTTRLRARVKKVVLANGSNPTTLYLSYLSGTASAVTFTNNQTISLESTSTPPTYTSTLTTSSSNAVGFGAMAFVNQGVYYVNGTFAYVAPQSVVMSPYTKTPTASVYLKINESIVGAEQDESLLDPAQGSNNYAAPGADRVKISLELVSIPSGATWTASASVTANTYLISGSNRYFVLNSGTLGTAAPSHTSGTASNGSVTLVYDGSTTISSDYIELMRYENGELLEHVRNSQYSELEKSLARRTYDESGNYVVTGLQPIIHEHDKALGGLVPAPNGDSSKLVVEVASGKAYIEGFEVDKISKTRITIDKARSASHIKSTDVNLRPTYGQYLYVVSPTGSLNIAGREQITLWNDNDHTNGSAIQIGTAKVLAIDYYAGDVASGTSVYKLWITDVTLQANQTLDDTGGIRYAAGRAWVVGEFVVSGATGTLTAGQVVTHSSGRKGTVWLWNASTARVYLYKHDHTQPLPRVGDLITQSSPAVTATVTSRVMVGSEGQSTLVFPLPKPIINTLQTTPGVYDIDYVTQKQYSITTSSGVGSVTVSEGIPQVDTGTWVVIKSDGTIGQGALTIPSGTTLRYTKTAGEADGTYTVYVNVAKTLSPRTKTLNQNVTSTYTVTADQATVDLGVVDVIRIRSIAIGSTDVTSSYTFNTGQTDYSYKNSSLTLKAGRSISAGTLTVIYDHYTHGTGDYFCVDSYASNVGYLDRITSFTSPTTGQTYDLLSAIDFRPSGATASDVVVSGTVFSTPIKYYVPRIDALAIDARGSLTIVPGVPSDAPKPPNVQSSQLALNFLYIPEYTRSAASVTVTRLDVERFTMQDIQKIVDRVERLEEFATLSAAETDIINYDIVDPVTGLSRFKTGYLVENFVQPLAMARTTSADFSASFVGRTLQPGQEKLLCQLNLGALPGNVVNKNGFLMKTYTEEVFINQPVSSRITTVNPFATISWNGILSVNPPVDEWVEILELPTIFETREELVDVLIPIPVPLPAVTPPGLVVNPPPARPFISPDIVIGLDFDLGLANGLSTTRTGSFNAINWWTPTSNGQAAATSIATALSEQQSKYPSRSLVDISLSAQLDPIVQDTLDGFASSLSVVGSTSSVQSTTSLVSGGLQRIVAR